ncbi:methyltransferase domain-containing protein [uncultured Amaricoccus sp.]|uniref:methyltransferase domain-containing protein n=1 Tax=uncultured Amaricoccus sp. TaxID=339341 RepID=UPI00261AD03F|nr:methyltransferase domain-containing protein [uncultured Amaricoccus sp.]
MPPPPILFDPDLLARRRARAERMPEDFLRRAVAEELSERLKEVNRSFRAPAIIGPRGALWAEALDLAGARLVPDREILDLEPEAHDLVIHALALHWANDPVGQIAQARRALRPDGLFLGALFAGETLRELREALSHAEIDVLGGLSPRVAPMGEIRELGGLLQRAGLALPVADGLRFDVTYPDPFRLMRDLRAMGETGVMVDRLRRPTPRAVFARAAALYAERFALPDGRLPATFEVVVLTGWAPAPQQQKPLRPGSARVRLADALGVPQRNAGEEPGG